MRANAIAILYNYFLFLFLSFYYIRLPEIYFDAQMIELYVIMTKNPISEATLWTLWESIFMYRFVKANAYIVISTRCPQQKSL